MKLMPILLEWALTSALLILAVAALRALLGKRVPAGLQYTLWAVVLVRLLIPVQLFPIFAPTARPAPDPRPVAVTAPPAPATTPVLSVGTPSVAAHEPMPSGAAEDYSTIPEPDPPKAQPLPLLQVLGWLWLGGSGAMAAAFAVSNLSFVRRLRRVRILLNDAACPLPVYTLEGIPSPCLFGLVRPAVYVTPEAAADPVMFRHVLAHEYTHFRHGDHIWNILRSIALTIHWWNPAVWLAVVLSRRDCELACDEGALKRLGDVERIAYGHTLLALLSDTQKHRPAALLTCATTMSGGQKSAWERITRIAKTQQRWLWAAVAMVLAASMACVCAFGAEKPEQPNPPNEDIGAAVQPSDNIDSAVGQDNPSRDVLLEASWENAQAVPDCRPDLNRDGAAETILILDEEISGNMHDYTVGVWQEDELLWTGMASDTHAGETSYLLFSRDGEDCLMEFNISGESGKGSGGYRMFTLENGKETPILENHILFDYCTDSIASVKDNFDPAELAAFVNEANGWLTDCTVLVGTGYNFREDMDTPQVDLRWLENYAAGFEWLDGWTAYENLLRFKLLASFPAFTRDIDQDMYPESVQVTETETGQKVELWNTGGAEHTLLWSEEANYSHAGAEAVFLCDWNGRDFLLRYRPYMQQGYCEYSYQLFTITRDGTEQIVKENHIEFQINITPEVFPGAYDGSFDPEAIADFMDEINGLLANSVLLINTDDDLMSTFLEEGRLYDHLWWLDIWKPAYIRDRGKTLEENLETFRRVYTEGDTAS